MAIELILATWKSVLDPKNKSILAVMANYANKDGEGIYPSLSTIKHYTSYNRRTIQRTIKELVEIGILKQVGVTNWGVKIYRMDEKKLPPYMADVEDEEGVSVDRPLDVDEDCMPPQECTETAPQVAAVHEGDGSTPPDPFIDPSSESLFKGKNRVANFLTAYLGQMTFEMSKATYDTYLKDRLIAATIEGKTIRIVCSSLSIAQWHENRLKTSATHFFKGASMGEIDNVEYVVVAPQESEVISG